MNISIRKVVLLAIIVCAITISLVLSISLIMDSDFLDNDADDDGVLDDIDAFPHDPSEQNDSDGDGIGDGKDDFPFDPSASMDTDGDGYPDKWNQGKSSSDSTSTPVLMLDDFPYDPTEWLDSDNDGIGDNTDVFPFDSSESRDDDNDGIGNNADHNPFVDLAFSFSLDQITLHKRVDILPWAQVYFIVKINGETYKTYDNNGSYYYIWRNRAKTMAKSFSYDIPETGSQTYTDIEILVFDHEWIKEDVELDVNSHEELKSVQIRLYHETNTLVPSSLINGNDASIVYQIDLPEEIDPTNDSITKTFNWMYKKKSYSISIDIPNQKYEWALQSTVNRSPQVFGSKAMAEFATVNDSVIQSLSNELQSLAFSNGITSSSDQVNFVLSFVQQNVYYWEDNASKDEEEYWRYPIETLVEKQGDCEDSAVLFASLIENMDYDAVLLFYIVEDKLGHLATGVSGLNIPDGASEIFKGKTYYYCETTSVGFSVGDKPNNIKTSPEEIIQVE